MQRVWIVLVGSMLGLAACTAPQDTFETADGQTFRYVDESYDLFPNRQEQGEAWRRQALGRELQAAGMCPSSYTVERRTESEAEERFGGGRFAVAYDGRC